MAAAAATTVMHTSTAASICIVIIVITIITIIILSMMIINSRGAGHDYLIDYINAWGGCIWVIHIWPSLFAITNDLMMMMMISGAIATLIEAATIHCI